MMKTKIKLLVSKEDTNINVLDNDYLALRKAVEEGDSSRYAIVLKRFNNHFAMAIRRIDIINKV